jgi:two-component system, LuxR family, response regulator FixJ
MENQNLVYVIDDDELIRGALDILLTAEGYAVETYASARDFLMAEPPAGIGCVLTDLQMPGGLTGIDLLRKIVKRGLGWPVIVMTGQATARVRETASRLGAFAFLAKPFGPEPLIGAVRNALESLDAT